MGYVNTFMYTFFFSVLQVEYVTIVDICRTRMNTAVLTNYNSINESDREQMLTVPALINCTCISAATITTQS